MTNICARRTGFCRRKLRPKSSSTTSAGVPASGARATRLALYGAALLVLILALSPSHLPAAKSDSQPKSQTAALAEYISTAPPRETHQEPIQTQARALGQFIGFHPAEEPREEAAREQAPLRRLAPIINPPPSMSENTASQNSNQRPPERLAPIINAPISLAAGSASTASHKPVHDVPLVAEPAIGVEDLPASSARSVLALSQFIFTKVEPVATPALHLGTASTTESTTDLHTAAAEPPAQAEPSVQHHEQRNGAAGLAGFIDTRPFVQREAPATFDPDAPHNASQPLLSQAGDAEQFAALDYRQQAAGGRQPHDPHFLVQQVQPLPEDELLKTLEQRQQDAAEKQETLEPIYADLKPIGAVNVVIEKTPGQLPTNYAAARFAEGPAAAREWADVVFSWEAPALCHNPLYFEEANVERYGYRTPFLQPVVSAANFFTHVPALPYLMGAERPRDCIYTLGYYRPGSYTPYRIQRVPLSVRGGITAAGVYTGLFYLIP